MVGNAVRFSVALLLGLVVVSADASDEAINLARGSSYTCVTAPNYWGWKGPQHGDRGQLTDGRIVDSWLSEGKPFYELSSSAGWSGQAAIIVVDLGRIESIGGFALHTVLSPWGPWWPSSIGVLVSDDNLTFYGVTNSPQVKLERIDPGVTAEQVDVAVARRLAEHGFGPSAHWYRSPQLQTKGRYVALIMDPMAEVGTIVLDEIEIYAGAAAADSIARSGPSFTEGEGGWKSYRLRHAVDSRLARDGQSLRENIGKHPLAPQARRALLEQLAELERRRPLVETPSSASFRAELPLNELHASVFSVQAALWRELGDAPLQVWQTHRWDPLGPFARSSGGSPEVRIVMARNAVRGAVLNLSNAQAQLCAVDVHLSAFDREHLTPFEVPLVDTYNLEPVTSALVPLDIHRGTFRVRVPSGMTRQIWLRADSTNMASGRHTGAISFSTTSPSSWSTQVPVSIEVLPVELPPTLSLYVGGWDYPHAGSYQVTGENVDAYTELLQAYGINTTWSRDVMGLGQYDDGGNLVSAPSRARFSQWLHRFPSARLYCTVLPFSLPPEDPHREKKLEAWAGDWSDYLQTRGVPPECIAILIRDEPTTEAELREILLIGQAIKRGEEDFKIWNDIHWPDPNAAPAVLESVMRNACDIQCFNVQHLLRQPEQHRQWITAHLRPDLTWWSYTGGGSHRLVDPYVGFQLRSWFSFQWGFTGAHWWSFGDGNGGFSWNEYLNAGTTRSPLYLSPDKVVSSKSMEAIREGAQDYELLTMLQNRVAAARTKELWSPTFEAASEILDKDVPQVLSVHRLDSWLWRVPKDRHAADRVREKILRSLVAMDEPPATQE